MRVNSKKIILVLGLLAVLGVVLLLVWPQPIEEEGFQPQVVVEGLNTPWAIDFLPDGRMIFTQREGKVSIWDGESLQEAGTIDVVAQSESGLLGIAVDPEFNENNYIYLYYTSTIDNRISRFTLNNQLEDETVILDGIPANPIHDGGRLKFGPDGKLYATTGDAGQTELSQQTDSLAGKILRLNKDGSIPEDNPFGNYVWSYGHRNPQGITWNTENGLMYAAEHGPRQNDEVNLIIRGGNYGWPLEECTTPESQFIQPISCYNNFTLASSGLTFFQGKLYVAGLRGNQLRQIILSVDGRSVLEENALFTNLGRIRDVVVYEDYLYISTSNRDGRGVPKVDYDKIIRIKVN
ncbi:MAG: PQQ-dependent sugar dehydrogenase [Euryarchaeota archaeon]|nr:PQQ-dependent sugar dehydrogenase [Euryarchaeota archaeon]MBV1729674.1 PQQ-dependent sugar dehydrogenase [Methanobacterium sp.]MBU4548301.1 PQQ-dependent sugar dehydrogenase [Euryarchaeota archaeon]MBU4607507.1 PQQ-dependent sugar dehydrogenase [Euryarchaeota archaeon]MBV1754451.1 PQQ-dependent sugar dehydrogenase [Methanobacterium sp.]